jgi:hypothetical protein
MSHTQFNLIKSNKNLTQLLLRLAWLNLKDKHMTTVTAFRSSRERADLQETDAALDTCVWRHADGKATTGLRTLCYILCRDPNTLELASNDWRTRVTTRTHHSYHTVDNEFPSSNFRFVRVSRTNVRTSSPLGLTSSRLSLSGPKSSPYGLEHG